MALDEKFAEAWLNTDHKVFGFKLQPFSIWHKLLLAVADSPVLGSDPEAISLQHLHQAVRICRVKYPNRPGKITIADRIRIAISGRRKKVEANVKAFTVYLRDYITSPEFWDPGEESTSNKGGAPDELSGATVLMMLGMSETEAWNTTVGKAAWYTAAYASWNGADLDFVTPAEKELRTNWAEMEAELMANAPPGPGPMKDDPSRFTPNSEPRL